MHLLQRLPLVKISDQRLGRRLPEIPAEIRDHPMVHTAERAVAADGLIVIPGLHHHIVPIVGLEKDPSPVRLLHQDGKCLHVQWLGQDNFLPPPVVNHGAVIGSHKAPRPRKTQQFGLYPGTGKGPAGGDHHPMPRPQRPLQRRPVAGGDIFLIVQQCTVQI